MDDFEDWFRRDYARVVRTLSALCGSLADAEDAAGEAFARAFERWRRVGAMSNPTGWTIRVGANHLKRQAKRRARSPVAAVEIAGISTAVTSPQVDHELWARVQALPPRQKEAVVYRYIADLQENEIATIMGIAPGTVAATLHAARRQLSQSITPKEHADERP